MSKLYSMGELLIDFQSVGKKPLKDTVQFVKNAGGAPANACVQAVKLGQKGAYLTKVGKDAFGDFLTETLQKEGVDVSYVLRTEDYDTSLAFVSLSEEGERQFVFYRRSAADLHFTAEDFSSVPFRAGDVFEFGSVALKTPEAQAAHEAAIRRAEEAGATVCFDPNLRFNLWESAEELKATVLRFARRADVIKVGKDELDFLVGDRPCPQAFGEKPQLLLVTDGGKGAKVYVKGGEVFSCDGYKVRAVDTTGAGDSFFGAFIAGLMERGATPGNLTGIGADLDSVLRFACKCGAYTTTGYGAIPAMGDRETIDKAVK